MGVKLGQKWAVKDGNLLASNRVGSRFFNKEFDFSRASNGTYVDRDGLLKTAELYNLIPYSEDFTQWQKLNSAVTSNLITSPSGVKNADLINYSITSSNGYIRLAHSAAQYITIYAKYKDIQWLMCYGSGLGAGKFVDIQNGVIGGNVGSGANAEIYDVGNGWKRIHFYSSSANITQFSIYAAESDGSYASISLNGGVYLWGAQAVEGTEPLAYQYTNGLQGLPRISFEDGVGHLLLEPQRSNLLLQSNSFDNASWLKLNGASISSNRVADPFGGTNAWELTFSATNDSRIQQEVTTSIGTEYTTSVWARVTSGTKNVRLGGIGSPFTRTLTTTWQRIQLTQTETDTIGYPQLRKDNTQGEYTIQIYAFQLESGSYPTSVIETTTTSVTRLADVCNNSGSAQDFNSEEGVLYAEVAALEEGQDVSVIALSDNSLSNRILIAITGGEIRGQYVSSGHNNAIDSSGLIVENFNKIACVYTPTTFKVFLNGSQIGSTISITTPVTGLSKVAFDRGDGGLDFNGKTRNLQVFTEALSDAELQKLTT